MSRVKKRGGRGLIFFPLTSNNLTSFTKYYLSAGTHFYHQFRFRMENCTPFEMCNFVRLFNVSEQSDPEHLYELSGKRMGEALLLRGKLRDIQLGEGVTLSDCSLSLEVHEQTDFKIEGLLYLNEFFNELRSVIEMDGIIPRLVSVQHRRIRSAFGIQNLTFEQLVFQINLLDLEAVTLNSLAFWGDACEKEGNYHFMANQKCLFGNARTFINLRN